MVRVLDANAFPARRTMIPLGLAERGPDFEEESFPGHLEQVGRRLPRRRLEEVAGLASELENVEVVVDQNRGRAVTAEQDAVGLPLEIHLSHGRDRSPA